MERYIGLDVHMQTCTMAVLGESGRRLRELVMETNGSTLVDAVGGIAGTRRLCMEEGAQSQWLCEVLEPHVDELVVIVPDKKRGNKSDSIDAWELAEVMRTRSWKRQVFKSTRRFRALREARRSHASAVKDLVRAKNRLKSVFRARGVTADDSVYSPERRANSLRKLPAVQRHLAEQLAARLDAATQAHRQAEEWLLEEANKIEDVRLLMTVPGIAEIRAAQIVAIVVTPHRFRTKRQFWSYCGLGLVTHSSADWARDRRGGELKRRNNALPRGLNRNACLQLKAIFKGAVVTVISMCNHPLNQAYQRLIEAGIKSDLARLTIARRIAAAVLAIWKNKEEYNPAKHCSIAA